MRVVEIVKLRASVRILRVVTGLLLFVVAVLLFAPSEGAAGASRSEVIDVGVRMRAIADERGLDANQADFYLSTPSLSVHLHFMGRRHFCPLHLHPRGHEGTIIVEGTAEVHHVFRAEGRLERRTATFGEGALIASPPACAHAFTNLEDDKALGNLVFSSPAFDHNTYLASDEDPRIGALAPVRHSYEDELRAFAEGGDAERVVALGAMGGAMHLLLVRGTKAMTPPASGVSVLYVLSGSGRIEADRMLPVAPKNLAIVRHHAPFAVHATAGSIVAAIVHASD